MFSEAPPEAGLLVRWCPSASSTDPRDADLVFDVRFLPNPHWWTSYARCPGTNAKVREYVEGRPVLALHEAAESLLDVVVPGYVARESYLTVAVGCTGGRHRSVVVATDLAEYFSGARASVSVDYRDVDRD